MRSGSPPRAWGKWGVRYRYAMLATVHPHGRGENEDFEVHLLRLRGSPPRAWGKCPQIGDLSLTVRFTPTGVGKIRGRRRGHRRLPVHPHGRGEN